jgi:hypothetical protein
MNTSNIKIISIILLIAITAGSVFIIPKITSAQLLGTGPLPVWCVPWDFNCLKEGILDTAAKAIMKSMIRQLRAATINWIITGDFEIKKPFFITSFIADPQRIADAAARTFLGELTGINFCSFHPNIRAIGALTFNLNLNQQLSCSFGGNYNASLDDFDNGGLGASFALRQSGNTFSTSLLDTTSKKEQAVTRLTAARLKEATLGNGFLGQRDPKTGKIKTPGNIIAESLIGTRNSEDSGNDFVDEIYSAIGDVVDTAIGKTIQDGLLK